MLTFGGCLLLGGRLGDLYGQRRIFILGISGFTVASVGCGLSQSQSVLIGFRALQGVGGALATAVGFALVLTLFPEPVERAKAMGITGFVASGGGAVGVVLGGVITDLLNWHWIFLVNVPIGAVVVTLMLRLVDESITADSPRRLDVAGAVTVTGALMLAVDAVVNGNHDGWTSVRTTSLLAVAAALFVSFLVIETRTAVPLMRLSLFRSHNLSAANVIGVLWAAAMFTWFFLSALYLQLVLGYSSLDVGLAFLPGDLVMMACSVSISAKLVTRYGFRKPLAGGLLIATIGLALFARAPLHGGFGLDVLPPMILLGVGAGIAFNPVLLAAMSDVGPEESGIASGLVNTSFMMGGALGLAALASIAAARSGGHTDPAALLRGYHLSFAIGAGAALTAALVGWWRIREPQVSDDELYDDALIESIPA
jgi:EmrB/QacA subfamily drug resistance transporter